MTYPEATQLGEWLDQLLLVEVQAKQLTDPLSEAQFNWRPGPKRWSVGECINHLAITTGLILERVRPELEQARARNQQGAPPFKLGWLGGWFTNLMEKPGRKPLPSPRNFVPPSGVPKPDVMSAFFANLQKLRNTITAADGLALDRITAPSSAKGAGWIRLNVAAWFASTLAHARRHLAQAERVKSTEGFPPG